MQLPAPVEQAPIAVAAQEDGGVMTFNDKAITFSGDLASYDYDSI